MNFRVGQKVVFVGGHKLAGEWGIGEHASLRKGGIYTIRDFEDLYVPYFGMVGIRVVETVYPCVLWDGHFFEPGYLAYKFRPIVEQKTDIAIFTRMLTPAKERV